MARAAPAPHDNPGIPGHVPRWRSGTTAKSEKGVRGLAALIRRYVPLAVVPWLVP